VKIVKNWINSRKLKKLRIKIDKMFDNIGCDELFYVRSSGKLYSITWTQIFAHIDEVTDDKEKRIELIKEYQDVKSRIK